MEGKKMKKNIYFFLTIFLLALPFQAHAAGGAIVNKVLLTSLGAALYADANLSANKNQSCMSCHHPSAGFEDPDNTADPENFPVSDGSFPSLFGGRNAPSASYASFSPQLHWDGQLFIGGIFWDGRASGLTTSATAGLGAGPTGDPLADQAKGPFLNPVEMALGKEIDVVKAVRKSKYAWLFQIVFPGVLHNNAKVGIAYNNISTAIAAFERSLLVNRFNSRFDKFVQEQGGDVSLFGVQADVNGFRQYIGPPKGFKSKYISYKEADGLALFNADSEVQLGLGSGANIGGMCYLCHITQRHDPNAYGAKDVQGPNPLRADGTYPPIFTDFSYDNLGIPKNPRIEVLAGPQATDYGLGASGRVSELQGLLTGLVVDSTTGIALDEQGKFKVSSLRNIAKTAPYGHNGYFPDLKSIVNFYNIRDIAAPGTFEAPEVPATMNQSELGNLGLSPEQEDKIIAFLMTLSDK
jgi:cytochrome c peroxidase